MILKDFSILNDSMIPWFYNTCEHWKISSKKNAKMLSLAQFWYREHRALLFSEHLKTLSCLHCSLLLPMFPTTCDVKLNWLCLGEDRGKWQAEDLYCQSIHFLYTKLQRMFSTLLCQKYDFWEWEIMVSWGHSCASSEKLISFVATGKPAIHSKVSDLNIG